MSRPVIPVQCSQFELALLKMMTRVERGDWPAVFSTNPAGAIWAFVTFSHTPEDMRLDLRGRSELLDHLADVVRERTGLGGRFFVSDKGVFLKQNEEEQVIRFHLKEKPIRKKLRATPGVRPQERPTEPAPETVQRPLQEQLMHDRPEFFADLMLGKHPLRRKKRWER